MIINKPYMCTKMDIWAPRYHDKAVLLSVHKVDHATSIIIINITKASAYKDGRYCITRNKARTYPIQRQGNSENYVIPMQDLEAWESGAEVSKIVASLWN